MERRAFLSSLAGTAWAAGTPSPASACNQAAVAYREGRVRDAQTLYESALSAHPRYSPALGGLGWIHFIEHRRRQATQLLGRAYQQTPDDFVTVRDYAAAAANPELEAILLQRLINLPATPPADRLRAQARLMRRQSLNGRTLNQLTSDYRPYRLKMPAAVHGWTLRVSLNGRRPLRLLFDTGARSLLINHRSAASLGLESLGTTQIGGFGDDPSATAQAALAERVEFDHELQLANVVVEVAPKQFVDGVDGLVGPDIFRHFLITCDGLRKELLLDPFAGAAAAEADGDYPWGLFDRQELAEGFFPYRRLGHLMLLEDRGTPGRQWVIDSGASYSIVHEEVPSLHADTVSMLGVSGASRLRRMPHPLRYHVAMAPAWSREVVATNLAGVAGQLGMTVAGFLGFPTLRDRVVTINPRNGSLAVQQSSELSAIRR
jgi:tetratricopeptide (TPR) repeat protein